MSNDIDIKKILEDFSKMKTKFFIDPPKIGVDKEFLKEDRKRLLMEAPQETRPTVRGGQTAEIVIKPRDFANRNLQQMTNCLTGEKIVSPTIAVYQKQETPNVQTWFEQQKSFSSAKKNNWIDACKYYYESKIRINRKAYDDWKKSNGTIEEPFFGDGKPQDALDKLDKSQQGWVTVCLQECFANSEQFEVGCAVRFIITDFEELTGSSFEDYIDPKFKEYEKFNQQTKSDKTITLTHQAWWAYYVQYYQKVKKEIDSFLSAEKSGGLKEGWWKSMPNFFSDTWQNKLIAPWKSMEIEKWGYSIDMGNDTWVKFEEKNLDIHNPDTGLQGETFYQYLPLTKEELSVKRGENPYNEDGRLKLGAGEYICMKPNAGQVQYRVTPEVNEDTGIFDAYDNWISWGSSEIVGKLLKSIHDTGWSVDGERVEYDDCYDRYGKLTCTSIPKRVDQWWYKVKLFSPVQDKYDTMETYRVVWVSSQTTEYCIMDKGDTQVSGTSFDQQSLYTLPMIPLKNPVGKNLQWSETVRPGNKNAPFKESEGYNKFGEYVGPTGIHYPGLGPKY